MSKYSYPYLQDSSFLKFFDSQRIKEQYVKIIILTYDEKPIKAIEGRVTGGNLNLDGNSSVRRTCNLSLVADDTENDLTNINNLFSINKKASIEIGFLNNTNYYTNYEYIWFPLGVYVMGTPVISHSTDGINISVQLRDKMCLLNGECGGVIPASVTLNEYDTIDESGNYVTLQPTIYQIIQELVNHFGGEQLGKIIISDLDTRVKKVMKWTGSTPLYVIVQPGAAAIQYTPTLSMDEVQAAVAKGATYNTYEYGDDIGYIYTDFVYPGELIGDAGATVCDLLDTIKDTLGNYEYFYDVDGNFIFQEVKNYLNTTQAKVELDKINKDDYLMDMSKGKAVYIFDDSNLVTSYSNTPQFNMIKNDFIVWGMREDINGTTFPIRYHLAIDQKPKIGNKYSCFFYTDPNDYLTKAKCPLKFAARADFPKVGQAEVFYMDTSTGEIYAWDASAKAYVSVALGEETIETKDWRTELYLQGSSSEPFASDSNYYYTELQNEWPKLYDVKKGKFLEEPLRHPTDIDFFLDFIDSSAAISELSISNIGRRQKVVVDDKINCVFEPEIPNLVLLNKDDPNLAELRNECEAQGQDYVQVDGNIYSMIAGGGSFNSAYNLVRELLYQYTSYNESIVLETIPMFYLEPNTRITVRDSASGIYGDYIINNISIPFDISSTMTISCTRALERL